MSTTIRSIHQGSKSTYGAPRIKAELQKKGSQVSRARIHRLMRGQGLITQYKSPSRGKIASKPSNTPPEPNILNQNFEAERPDEKWATDITYIKVKQGWLYLSVIIDLYSRIVVGWAMDTSLHSSLPSRALNMAFFLRKPRASVLHHSDQGSQYTSAEYRLLLKNNHFVSSMSRKGNCYDNSVVESFFGTLKTELNFSNDPRYTREEAENRIFEWIEGWYNPRRLHSKLGYVSPLEYERLYESRS